MLILIDNYDSFTWNLWHLLSELGTEVTTVRNDALSVAAILAKKPAAIVMSPGPGIPQKAGVCVPLIADLAKTGNAIPLLGVCLGHQAIAVAFGGKIGRIDPPVHGKLSTITHNGDGVFRGCPPSFAVTRYHSLVVAKDSLPDCLAITASTEAGVIMGLQHKQLPFFGVQFHPESAASQHGYQMLANFLVTAGLPSGDNSRVAQLQQRMPNLVHRESLHA